MTTVSLEEIAANPDRYKQQPNGVWRDGKTGQWCNAAGSVTPFTQATATRANDTKRELWEANFTAGMAEHAGSGGSARAIQLIGANITSIATTNAGLPAVKAAAEVARLGGWVERAAAGSGNTVNVLNVVDGRGVAELVRIIRDNDVIDME